MNIGFIGLGYRAELAVRRFTYIKDVTIKAICDIDPGKVKSTKDYLEKRKIKHFDIYSDYKHLLEDASIDTVYISTPWHTHSEIAVNAMKSGKHAAIEVPAAKTLNECFELIKMSKQTNKQCCILENCCFDDFTMASSNMVKDGLFGEIYHCEGAYIHRLCERYIENNRDFKNNWMINEFITQTGNIYPTHGFGPISKLLDLNNTDRVVSINSISSSSNVYSQFVCEHFNENVNFSLADINTSILKTQKGKTIMLQLDMSTPRPYSRKHIVCGTKGFFHKYPTEEIAFLPDYNHYICKEEKAKLLNDYRDPFYIKSVEAFSKVDDPELIRRGVMDFAMDLNLVEAINENRTFMLDVYDAALWSSITELSQLSLKQNGAPIDVPDFKNLF
ncbi:MAG: Gfo/Idh/MocA family oxidoreductase [Bacteroidales bacterium]|nr:Gfo/Idh/MocA family oxidoreductase [Bacteroidales bacterium]